jgi:hypothetical protein
MFQNTTDPILYTDYLSHDFPPKIENSDKPRIAIVMLNSPNIPNYAHFATMNNYLYATNHGYDFIVERLPLNTREDWTWDPKNEYTLVWYKAEFIKRHLKNYHYLLFIDSDATFVNIEYTIEKELIERYNDDFRIIFQEDVWRSIIGPRPESEIKKICAGLVFLKNCQETLDVLDVWIRAPYSDPRCFQFRYRHAREQDCIMYLKDNNPVVKKHIKIFPAHLGLFGQYDSNWILHLGGVLIPERSTILFNVFNHYYKKLVDETNEKNKNTHDDGKSDKSQK